MTVATPVDRTKLARVLAMLGSNHAGERDAAGLAADRMMRNAGLSWDDLLRPVMPAAQQRRQCYQPDGFGVTGNIRLCLQNLGHLTAWERDFIYSVEARPRLSERQAHMLRKIADRFRDRGFA